MQQGDSKKNYLTHSLKKRLQHLTHKSQLTPHPPGELDERLILLETRVGDQFNVLKAMVLDLETKLRDQDQQVKRQHRGLHRAILAANKRCYDRSHVYIGAMYHNCVP